MLHSPLQRRGPGKCHTLSKIFFGRFLLVLDSVLNAAVDAVIDAPEPGGPAGQSAEVKPSTSATNSSGRSKDATCPVSNSA